MENEEIVIDIKNEPDDDTNKSNEQFSPLTKDKSIVAQDIGNIDIKVENTIDKKIHVIQSLHENNGNLRSTANHIQHKPSTHTVNAFHGDFEHKLHKEIGNTIKNDEFCAWDKHTGDTSVCGFNINYCPDQHAENSLNQTLICSNEIYDSHKALKIKQELTGDVNTEIFQPYTCTEGNSIAEVCSEIANENDTCKQQTVNWSHVFIPCQAECVDNKIKQEQNEEFDMEICQARRTSADTNANNENALPASKEANLDNPLLFGYEKTCSGAFQIKIESHEMPEEDDCLVKDEGNESEFKSLLSRNMPMSCEQDADSYEHFNSMETAAKQNLDKGYRISEETKSCVYNITTEEGNKAAEITVNATPLTLIEKVITKDSQVQLKIKKQYRNANSTFRKCFHCPWRTSSEKKYKVHLQSHINKFNMARKHKAEVDLHVKNMKRHFEELNLNMDVVKCKKRTCVYIFLDDEWASKHYLTFHERKAFVCSKPSCFRTFQDKWKLKSHEIVDHAFINEYIKARETKKISFGTQTDVMRRAEAVSDDHNYTSVQLEAKHEGKAFVCSKPSCFKTFEDKWKLKSHEIVDHAFINENIKARETKKNSFDTQTDVWRRAEAVSIDHSYINVQPEAKRYRCDVSNCFKLFKYMPELKSHKIWEHTGTVSFSGNDHQPDLKCTTLSSGNVRSENKHVKAQTLMPKTDTDPVLKGVLYSDERGNIFHGSRDILKINKPIVKPKKKDLRSIIGRKSQLYIFGGKSTPCKETKLEESELLTEQKLH